MGDACKRDTNLWCPLSEEDCKIDRSKPCVLLTPTQVSLRTLHQMGYMYDKNGIIAKVKEKPRYG
jgi:hypothetical protein